MNITITTKAMPPFIWQGREYKVEKAGLRNDKAYAVVSPAEPALEEEFKHRLAKDKGLKVYWGNRFVCFIEDYAKGRAQRMKTAKAK